MNEFPVLRQLVHRLMTHPVGMNNAGELAFAAVAVYTKLLSSLSPLLGEVGSTALFRRSLKLTEGAFPCYAEARGADQRTLLNAVEACLRKQAPEGVQGASVALLAAYVELLATLIGERLTRQLLQDAWPELLASPPEEKQHE